MKEERRYDVYPRLHKHAEVEELEGVVGVRAASPGEAALEALRLLGFRVRPEVEVLGIPGALEHYLAFCWPAEGGEGETFVSEVYPL